MSRNLPVILLIFFFGCAEENKLFTPIEVNVTAIHFENSITETDEININQYLYAHNGGGVAAGDINNDGLPDLYFTANQLPNKLYLNKGNFKFEDISEQAGVLGDQGQESWTTGVCMADVNGDGLLDIYVSQVSSYGSFKGANKLYINNGDLTFEEKAAEYGLDSRSYSQQAAFFDYDLDGDLDMFQLNHSVHSPEVYKESSIRSRRDSLAGDKLLRNDGAVFTDVSEDAGIYGGPTGYGLAVGIGDIDNNGCPDIYVSNDFHENDYVYYNNCDGTFREAIRETLRHSSTFSMGNDIADFNNDGLLDILTLDMMPEEEEIRKKSAGPDPYDIYNYKLSFGYFHQFPRNMLQMNRGNLFENNVQFSEIGQLAGVEATDWSWSGLFADLDNDGWKDIFITNGIIRRPIDLDYINFTHHEGVKNNESSLEMALKMPDGEAGNYAYKNRGDLTFENVSAMWGLDLVGYSMGSAYVDLDNDGDLDLVVNNLNAPASVYKNNSELLYNHHFLRVRLAGEGMNTFGIGARVEIQNAETSMMQEMSSVRGWLSSVDPILTFGLGKIDRIDHLKVTWPNGDIQELTDVSTDQTLVLRQVDAKNQRGQLKVTNRLFEDITVQSGIGFHHVENSYSDFNYERLLPHTLSTEGPHMAIGDVNSDGKEDLFIGGAVGQPGAIYMQREDQDSTYFEAQTNASFEEDKDKEDIESVFFDADGDGDLDLYVVSGGGHHTRESDFHDRLYLNGGKGSFVKSKYSIPEFWANGSCVVAADFNGDKAIDLFVGTRSVVGNYGISPDSYLLWNDGKGAFSFDESDKLQKLGMVTDASWNPEQNELIVAGEWMPVTLLKFESGTISKRELSNTSGWWNTVHAVDLDKDGDQDLLLGNLGLNTHLRVKKGEPLGLYVNDYDRNRSTDPIMTYFRHGKEWIFLGLDEIKKQIPSVRLKYNNYSLFARHTFPEVFSEELTEESLYKKAEMLESTCFINDGRGNYKMQALPTEAQLAPVYSFSTGDFDEDGVIDILSVGNQHGNTPAIGKFDASYGAFLKGIGDNAFVSIEPFKSGFRVQGETRDLKLVNAGRENWIIVGRNDGPVQILKHNPASFRYLVDL